MWYNSRMAKCDVIIPVYKSPEWVELCLYALFQNTRMDTLGKVFLINDSDDAYTKNCLKNFSVKYGDKVVIKQNKKNLGFTGTVNRGLCSVTAEYVLLLNADCLVSKNTIEKLLSHMQTDEKIGLICPISSNAANLSLDMLEGFTYTQMDELLESRFKGMLFDACTVVGNCLMISKKCIDEVGLLDEIYSPGYGEETDYQFAAMKKGFSAKVAIDTYVFHKAETSFGISDEKRKMIDEHLATFFSRWGKEYKREMRKYEENDPIKFVLDDFKKNPPKVRNLATFYMMNIEMSGGCNVVVDIVNRLAINGCQCNILYDNMLNYSEPMLFQPISMDNVDKLSTKKIVATLWATVFLAKRIAMRKKWELVYFVQGLEQHFENGQNYGAVEVSYRIAKSIITVSEPLRSWLEDIYGIDSYLIRNGINLELLKKERKNGKPRVIMLIARGDYRKGDYVLFDVLRKIDVSFENVIVKIIVVNKNYTLPLLHNKKNQYEIIGGPLTRVKIFELMQKSDIYVDTSSSEGFGLTALESMAAGCIPIVSNSFGVLDYLVDSENGLLVNEVNNADAFLNKIRLLMSNADLCKKIHAGMINTINRYDFTDRVCEYESIICGKTKLPANKQDTLNNSEKKISEEVLKLFIKEEEEKEETTKVPVYSRKQRVMRGVVKHLPKPARCLCVKIVEFLKSCY